MFASKTYYVPIRVFVCLGVCLFACLPACLRAQQSHELCKGAGGKRGGSGCWASKTSKC